MSKELSKITEILEMGEDGDFSLNIKSIKKRELKTKTVSIFMESAIYKDMVNRPFIFILLPFFCQQNQRNLNLIYEIENAGINFSSYLSSDTLEEYTNKQPGEFEKNVLDFIMWKFQNKIEKEQNENENIYEIFFYVSEVVEYIGVNYHSSYYKKVEEALYNLQETTYKIRIRNQKKAGNIIREVYEKPLNLIRYTKIKEKNLKGGKEKVSYHVELDKRIIDELKIKHYSIFDKELLSSLRKKNKMAERIYQFISMKRFSNSSGIFRIETLASIIPLNLYSIIKKKCKDGSEKEYRVSKKKNVLSKLVKAFEDLIELEYLTYFEVIELKEENSFKIKYEFNQIKDNFLHKSTYLELENNELVDKENDSFQEINLDFNSEEVFENELEIFVEHWKEDFDLAREDVEDIRMILKELSDEFGLKRVVEDLKNFGIKDIVNLEGTLREFFKEKPKNNKTQEKRKVYEKDNNKALTVQELEIFKTLYSSFTKEKQIEINKKSLEIYKEELGNKKLKIFDLTNYEKENVKILYIRKAMKELIGI